MTTMNKDLTFDIIGDFNLDLFKFEPHPETKDFLNTLIIFRHISSPKFCKQPGLLTIHDIFLNALEHFTIY